jgi:hypothetical protein
MLTKPRYAYGLELPEEVIKHPSIQRIETIATDIVLMYGSSLTTFLRILLINVDKMI